MVVGEPLVNVICSKSRAVGFFLCSKDSVLGNPLNRCSLLYGRHEVCGPSRRTRQEQIGIGVGQVLGNRAVEHAWEWRQAAGRQASKQTEQLECPHVSSSPTVSKGKDKGTV